MYIMCTKRKLSSPAGSQLCMSKTVKAREHHGANSLDLTLPAEVVRDYNVNPGDIFEIEVEEDGDELALTYTRVYESEG